MKRHIMKRISIVLTFMMLITFLGNLTSFAAQQKEMESFTHKLGVGVNADWKKETKTLTIYGDGKIENKKWEALAKLFHQDNFSNQGGWVKNNFFTIVFADKTVRFPDNTMIGNYGFFQNFEGKIELPAQIDTSNVRYMNNMFAKTVKANPDVSNWNTSNVVSMAGMFSETQSANPDVRAWDVSRVEDMNVMFSYAKAAKPDVSKWRTSSLKSAWGMFNGASSIVELDLSNWGRFANIPVGDAFHNLPNLKYLEFSGLTFDGASGGIHINNFAGAYFVERLDGSVKTDIVDNPSQGYKFENNKAYRLSLICHVKFDSDGGTPVDSIKAGYNSTIKEPKEPTRKGYRFVRWEHNGMKFDFKTPIKSNINLKALWIADAPQPAPTPPPQPQGELKVVLRLDSPILEKIIHGYKTEVRMDSMPFVESGRVMLPLRYAAEALGMGVDWNNQSKLVILKDKKNEVQIPIYSTQIIVNNRTFYSDVMPVLRSGRTYLSVSNIAKPLGLEHGKTIFWDNDTKTATFIRNLAEL